MIKSLNISAFFQSLSSFYQRHFGQLSLSETTQYIVPWFDHAFGQRLLSDQQKALDGLMSEIHGYHLMELSVLEQTQLTMACSITHQFRLSPNQNDSVECQAIFEALPIKQESIDVAFLHHALEYSINPHQLLREVCRSIIPNGYIVIVGFNPISFIQLKKIIGRYVFSQKHWRYHFLLRHRIEDWLRLLDFEVVYKKNAGYDFPMQYETPSKLKYFWRLFSPLSANFYILVARKTIYPVTMIKPWQKKHRLTQWVKRPAISRDAMQSITSKNKYEDC